MEALGFSHNWWWELPLAVGLIGIIGYVVLMIVGITDWMNRGSH